MKSPIFDRWLKKIGEIDLPDDSKVLCLKRGKRTFVYRSVYADIRFGFFEVEAKNIRIKLQDEK